MSIADLAQIPESIGHAIDLVDRIDQAFHGGFARLGGDAMEALAGLRGAFAATPLGAPLAKAIEGIERSEFIEHHFLVVAAARAALQGAEHDALVAKACAALGRPTPVLDTPVDGSGAAQAAPPQIAVWLESARHWLMELALAGFANLDIGAILPFQATLDSIQSDARLVRHATLLGGFLGELLDVFPARGQPDVPLARWADLWSRAMVLAAAPPAPAVSRKVKGTFRILGADLRQHDTFASLVVYGSLREAGRPAPRVVRTTLSAHKVDVILGDELGALLGAIGPKLVAALGGGGQDSIQIDGMDLYPTNDLIWNDAKASAGGKGPGVIAEAQEILVAAPADRPGLDPADRHPALIEELVFLKDYSVDGKDAPRLIHGGAPLAIAYDRWPTTADLLPDDLKGSAALVGLLRFDAGAWSIQPLAVDKKKGVPRMIGSGLRAAKGKNDALGTLRERAKKLLRKAG